MKPANDDVICYCSGTTQTQITTLLTQGFHTLEAVSRATGACSGCGACDVTIIDFLAAYAKVDEIKLS